ncbi:MAG: DNA polymerase III subunit delta' [Desulfobulbaceae bacterium]|nr:DNA polymerase III subunit delta' [Desulfobulbaceae bacterium]
MFAETLGQKKAVGLLSRSLENGRLAHAYLFSGPRGVGKKTTARQFAAVLLCRHEGMNGPCGTCSSCVQFASGNNPDFVHIKPQGAMIKIDQVRALKKALSYPPLEAPRRVIMLEDVHTMRREAGNSLLKLLEEPPPDNILLLTADDSEPLLPTIVSRCQIIPFYPLPVELAAQIIARRNSSLTAEEALRFAQLAGGCPGLAGTFDIEGLLPAYEQTISRLLNPGKSESARVESALELALQAAELKEGLEQLFDLLRLFFKESMLAGLRAPDQGSEPRPMDDNILRARERWNLQQLSDKVQVIDFVAKTLARNCNRQMACEVLFLKLFSIH